MSFCENAGGLFSVRAEAEALRVECARDLLTSLNLAIRSFGESHYLYELEADLPEGVLNRARIQNILIIEDDGTIADTLIPTLVGRKIPVPTSGTLAQDLSRVTRGDPVGSKYAEDSIACWTRVRVTATQNVWICVVLWPHTAPRDLAASAGALVSTPSSQK